MKKLLAMVMALGAVFGVKAAAPEGYTDLGGTYSFKVDDEHANSGKWYINGEFQPVNGASINGADWYVDSLIAFQANGQVLNLKSGSLIWTRSDYGGGVYPDNDSKYLNFVPGSTLKCSNPNIPMTGDMRVFLKCFKDQWSNFRYDNEKITDEDQFKDLFVVEAYGENGSTFYLKPTDDVSFNDVSVSSAGVAGALRLTATFLNAGDGTATITAVWDTEDKGTSLASWANSAVLGTQAAFATDGGTITGLSEGTSYRLRLFATASSKTTYSSCTVATLYKNQVVVGPINRWIGGEGSYNVDANWSQGRVPVMSDVRWVDSGVIDCTAANAFYPNPQDMFIGGKLVVKELQPNYNGIDLRGSMFECVIIAPQGSLSANSGFDVSAGAIIVTGTDNDGFWRENGRYLNLPVNSTASLTFPFSVTETYNRIIATGKVRYDGRNITRDDFEDSDQWTVTAVTDSKTMFSRKVSVEGAPALDAIGVTLDTEDDTTVLVYAPFTTPAGHPLTSATLKYGTDLAAMNQTLALTAEQLAPADGILRFTVTGLTRRTKYYFTVVAANDTAETASNTKGIVAYAPVAPCAVWVGSISSDADVAGNWLPAAVPTADSEIEIYDTFAANTTINWNLSTSVKSWTQKSYENGAVNVRLYTTLERPLVVTGDMTVESGLWYVPGVANERAGLAPEYAFNLQVGGNLTVSGAAVLHAGRGRNAGEGCGSGWYNAGPGYVDIGGEDAAHWPLYGRGSSFGGDGGYRTADYVITCTDVNHENHEQGATFATPAYELPLSFVSYGSILNPMDWGSSGHGDNAYFAGGGLVKIVVGGALTLDGKIESVGFGYPGLGNGLHNGTAGASTGGSINITAKSLAGSGTINADGGCDEMGGNGSGGRIRVKLTGAGESFDGNTINMHAKGGMFRDLQYQAPRENVVDAAAGTIALQTANDGETAGKVIIRHEIRKINGVAVPVGATHFPAMQDGDRKLNGVKLVVEADTFVRLTREVTISGLTVAGNRVPRGVYTAAQLNAAAGTTQFLGGDDVKLTIGSTGLVLSLR